MEEKKSYNITGTVTISTDEYRDLITEKFEAQHDKDRYMREGWKKDEEINALNKQIEALKAKLEKLENFIKKNSINISQDSVAVFMSMFGEE